VLLLARRKQGRGRDVASRANAPWLFLTSPTSVGRQEVPLDDFVAANRRETL
jgi:hypothetical protein